jgi:hypothetical protein
MRNNGLHRETQTKFAAITERCIYLDPSPSSHSHDTYKLWQLSTGKIIIRRNVAFNERIYPGYKTNINPGPTSRNDDGADFVGLDFLDEGTRFTITGNRTGSEAGKIATVTWKA